MSQDTPGPESAVAEPVTLDEGQVEALKQRLRSDQNLLLGGAAGAVAALLGAVAWAAITVFTGYVIGFMAIGVGFVVGMAVGKFGKGIDTVFGVVGAALALVGCAVGNSLAAVGIIARDESVPYFEMLGALSLQDHREIMVAFFSPMDLLFYAIAVYVGFRYAFRTVTEDEVASITEGSSREV